ncbi:hypothetical protein H072_1976 [Dactylellina haptotyla CBS 200.50]|uniref:SnoaL-like domain-containing protein n=1 Tax=Dactylellina haptotyla (strain CBS 200.50) TaxID=1284197 RepID=S8BX41_DACHA|nr:hypothetical protein H072_1976 [Dactylellina haptotyla CBS 200.50]
MQQLRHFVHSCTHTPSSTPATNCSSFSDYFSIRRLDRSRQANPHHHRIQFMMEKGRPKLFITADTNEFDRVELAKWEAEGYDVQYIPRADTHALELLADSMESDEKYSIIAFGTAATIALEYAMYPVSNLAALIAYYPTGLPSIFPQETFPQQIRRILLHLSDAQPFSIGENSCRSLKVRTYQDTKPGFAEKLTVHYNSTAANLAYSRTLAALRETIGPDVDLEDIWGEHLLYKFVDRDANKTMDTMVKEPYVNHIPTMAGGVGYHDLQRFYRDFFIPHNPPSLRLRLISRTVGTDRIVDEMICNFTHTEEMNWILPGVKPTGGTVSIALVSIVCIRGSKLYHEHIYWDQASVLKQIGAVDFGSLPVVGAEAARKLEDKEAEPSNHLLPGWKV